MRRLLIRLLRPCQARPAIPRGGKSSSSTKLGSTCLISATSPRYWARAASQLTSSATPLTPRKPSMGAKGIARAGGVPEAGEHVFETRVIVRRPVRPARRLLFFRAAGRSADPAPAAGRGGRSDLGPRVTSSRRQPSNAKPLKCPMLSTQSYRGEAPAPAPARIRAASKRRENDETGTISAVTNYKECHLHDQVFGDFRPTASRPAAVKR